MEKPEKPDEGASTMELMRWRIAYEEWKQSQGAKKIREATEGDEEGQD